MVNLLNPDFNELVDNAMDITKVDSVEIQIKEDGKVIWINVFGICVLRICQIKTLEVNDLRRRK